MLWAFRKQLELKMELILTWSFVAEVGAPFHGEIPECQIVVDRQSGAD